MGLAEKMMDAGFTRNEKAKKDLAAKNAKAGSDKGGPHTVQEVLTKGDVTIVVEQNVGSDDLGGLPATVTYPAVAIIEGPKGRVAFNPNDTALAERLAAELA